MKYLFNIVIVIVFLVLMVLILKKVFIFVIKEIKDYKKSNEQEKEKLRMLFLIFLTPIILVLMDYFDIFSKVFPKYFNLTREYDWLSFIGAYSGAIVSAILLIFITEKDRSENTAVLRTSQRPYLDISYLIVSDAFFEDNKQNIIVYEHGNSSDKKTKKAEYLTLCIKNTGATVAIIDTNKTRIKLYYVLDGQIEKPEFTLNFSINRLSISSGEKIYIKFIKDELYKNGKLLNKSRILSSTVFYRDLFNKHYYDECELKSTLEVLHDNEEL